MSDDRLSRDATGRVWERVTPRVRAGRRCAARIADPDDLRQAIAALEDWVTQPLKPGDVPRDDLGAISRLRATLEEK